MRTTVLMIVAGIFGLSGCFSSKVPNSAAHVKPVPSTTAPVSVSEPLDPLSPQARQIRDAELKGTPLPAPVAVETQTLAPVPATASTPVTPMPKPVDEASDVASDALDAFNKSIEDTDPIKDLPEQAPVADPDVDSVPEINTYGVQEDA